MVFRLPHNYLAFLFLSMLLLLNACHIKIGDYIPRDKDFIPGECLTSSELKMWKAHPNDVSETITTFRGVYNFNFVMDLDMERKTLKPRDQYWRIPSDNIFSQYGSKENRVKEDYHNIRKSFSNQQHPYVFTILYSGGLSLTADRDFAGHPAGSELTPYLEQEIFGLTKKQGDQCLELPFDYYCMVSDQFFLNLLVPGYGVTEARTPVPSVTFELKIPVKVVLYLTWLNDRISDEDAPMSYRDDTLHCVFTVKDLLKKIE